MSHIGDPSPQFGTAECAGGGREPSVASFAGGGQAALALSKLERVGMLTLWVALWLILGQSIFFWWIFFWWLSAQPSHSTTLYFVAVLTCLGMVM